ncbi:hypothetical protein [Malikia granosa]|uniref:hypothetical protein n=1 Tax=Malikia granosa TaxID=263067 RepID=UPI0011B062FC|nr:hypothetical protein [Malikia granosa]
MNSCNLSGQDDRHGFLVLRLVKLPHRRMISARSTAPDAGQPVQRRPAHGKPSASTMRIGKPHG